VYPTVLPLSQCPIVDALGQDSHAQMINAYQTQAASHDLTRTLRPYRWGDSMRLIHWRTSARYGDLRVRELETYTGGQELIVALDNAIGWEANAFEQAVVAAASLYFYGLRCQMRVSLWTALGQMSGEQAVLEALAAVQPYQGEAIALPSQAILWLTQNPDALNDLPEGSRWLLWQPSDPRKTLFVPTANPSGEMAGVIIQPDRSPQLQLQEPSR
jgi:uncharacterized protein (DUF58 family)